jgi:DNA-binding MarR family transcriptional regulator
MALRQAEAVASGNEDMRRPPKAKTQSAAAAPAPGRDPGDGWRHDNVGRLLNNAVSRFESRVLELMSQSGHPEARISHVSLTRNLDLAGTRVTELARRAGMTKQAMGELVSQCGTLKLVVTSVDPADKRARVVRFTPAGLRWLDAFRRAVDQAEREMRDEVGAMPMDVLRGALALYGADFDALSGRKPGLTK